MNMKRLVIGLAGAVGAMTAAFAEDPFIDCYVQEGLVAQWDAVDNLGTGVHSGDTETWYNRTDPSKWPLTWRAANWGKVKWTDDAAQFVHDRSVPETEGCGWFTSADNVRSLTDLMGDSWTIETAVIPTSGWFANYSGICGNADGLTVQPVIGQFEVDTIRFRTYPIKGEPSGVTLDPADVAVGELQTFSFADSPETVSLCINGAEYASAVNGSPDNSTLDFGSCTFLIGAACATEDRMFDGTIHNVRIYDRVLTPAEVALNAAIDGLRFGGKSAAGCIIIAKDRAEVADTGFEPALGASLGNTIGEEIVFTAPEGVVASLVGDDIITNLVVTGWTLYVRTEGKEDFEETDRGEGVVCQATVPNGMLKLVWNITETYAANIRDISVDGYIKDGLIAQWDGEDNLANGVHDGSSSAWYNRVDPDKWPLSWFGKNGGTPSWSGNAAVFQRSEESGVAGNGFFMSGVPCSLSQAMGNSWTIEAVVNPNSDYFNNNSGICGNSIGSRRGPVFGQVEGAVIQFRTYVSDSQGNVIGLPSGVAVSHDTIISDEINVLSFTDCPESFSLFRNGERIAGENNGLSEDSTVDFDEQAFLIGSAYYTPHDQQYWQNRVFSGSIHSVRIYNRVLTDEEVAYNAFIDSVRIEGGVPTNSVQVVGDLDGGIVGSAFSPAFGNRIGYLVGDEYTFTAPTANVSDMAAYQLKTNLFVTGWTLYRHDGEKFTEWKSGEGNECSFTMPETGVRLVWETRSEVEENVGGAGYWSYVQDGLIVQWDAANNTGMGFTDVNSQLWYNLVDRDKYAAGWAQVGGPVSWKNGAALFSRNDGPGKGWFSTAGDTGLDIAMGDEWTIEVSIRPDAGYFQNHSGICGNSHGGSRFPYLGQYEFGNLVFRTYVAETDPSGFSPAATIISAGERHTFAFSDTPETACLHLDGMLSDSVANGSANNSTLNFGGAGFMIGAAYEDSGRVFSGEINCVRIYNRKLTDDELARNAVVDEVRFNGVGGGRQHGYGFELLTRFEALADGRLTVDGKSGVKVSESWGKCETRRISVAADTDEGLTTVWKGIPAGAVMEGDTGFTVETAYPIDVYLDAYDPADDGVRVVKDDSLAVDSLSGISSVHVENGTFTVNGAFTITAENGAYAVIEGGATPKITLLYGAKIALLGDLKLSDLTMPHAGSTLDLNGFTLTLLERRHLNGDGWAEGAVVDLSAIVWKTLGMTVIIR